MTENKRFKVKGFDEYDQMVWDTEFEQSCSVEQVVNMLNDKDDTIAILNEENEQLKSDLRYWRTLAQSLAKKNNVGDVE